MSRIDLRGVIVPSEYDTPWAEGYIGKGIIIPESRFRANLATANKTEPLTVYVNSPGGSVFSAGEMVNAVREWKAETKQPVNVVLGALTASAASAFAIMVADKISAHANAKMMFHGAWTVSVGGKEMHQDTAELLGKINADIKARLVSKYGMEPEIVTQWFAEGREGWLSAKELVSAKLATEIIEDPSDAIEFTVDAVKAIDERGLGIAAFLNTQTKQEVTKPIDATSADYQAGLAAGRAEQAGASADAISKADEQCRRLQGDRDKARAETEKLTTELSSVKAAASKTLADATEAHAAAAKKIDAEHAAIVADMSAKLATAQQKCERLVSGGMTFSPEKADKVGRTAADVDPRNRLHKALR